MDSDNQEQYLQKLQEFVYDEDKIVTYSWLSTKLNLDVNSCKTLLKIFENDQREVKKSDLGVTFIISGILEENNNISVVLTKQDEIESKKKIFKTIFSEFIYSIQKNKVIDLDGISMVDICDVHLPRENPISGSVISKNCIKRNLKEKKVIPVAARAASTDKSKGSHIFGKEKTPIKVAVKTEPKENGSTDKVNSKPIAAKTNGGNKGKTAANKGAGIASFFSKAPIKTETKPAEIAKEKESLKQEKMDVDDDSDTEIDEQVEAKETIKKSKISPKEKTPKKSELYDSGTDEEALKIEESNKKKASQTSAKKTKKKPAKRQRKDASEERPQKRRKRILTRNESDSDDMFKDEDDEKEDIVEDSEEEEPVIKKTKAALAPLNKKRKLVDKTYTDDEGYIVTKKEWAVDSASDPEEEIKEQKNPQLELKEKTEPKEKMKNDSPKETKKKNASPKEKDVTNEVSPTKGVKGKKGAKQPAANQPTLMSFFKKK